MPQTNYWQRSFLTTLLITLLVIPGRKTFTNLGRYSNLHERTYRRHFNQAFDFAAFNQACITATLGSNRRLAVAIDATFIPKSGKQTYGLDLFYSSTAGKAQRGLELSEIALIDLDNAQAYSLSCRQTQARAEGEHVPTRLEQYATHLNDTYPSMPTGVTWVLFDGYYAKRSFVDAVCALGLHGIGRLRVDADLRYLYQGAYQGRGRPKRYDGKVDICKDSHNSAGLVYQGELEPKRELYSAEVWSCALKRVIRLVMLRDSRKAKPRHVLLFSTDLTLEAHEIVGLYRLRFQIEFLIRDSKQFTGLTDGQMRNAQALDFHFNAAFAAVNVAKLHALERQETSEPFVFSLDSCRRELFNAHLLDLFFSKLGLDATQLKSLPAYQDLVQYGSLAA